MIRIAENLVRDPSSKVDIEDNKKTSGSVLSLPSAILDLIVNIG